jgi:hypothetical protein
MKKMIRTSISTLALLLAVAAVKSQSIPQRIDVSYGLLNFSEKVFSESSANYSVQLGYELKLTKKIDLRAEVGYSTVSYQENKVNLNKNYGGFMDMTHLNLMASSKVLNWKSGSLNVAGGAGMATLTTRDIQMGWKPYLNPQSNEVVFQPETNQVYFVDHQIYFPVAVSVNQLVYKNLGVTVGYNYNLTAENTYQYSLGQNFKLGAFYKW